MRNWLIVLSAFKYRIQPQAGIKPGHGHQLEGGMTATEIKIRYPYLIIALNTCAIGGNQFARKKLALLKDDPAGFAVWAEKFLSHKGLG